MKKSDINYLRIVPRAEWLAIVRRWLTMVRWIVSVGLLALVPKCAVCVAAYLGLAGGLGVAGRELCGGATGTTVPRCALHYFCRPPWFWFSDCCSPDDFSFFFVHRSPERSPVFVECLNGQFQLSLKPHCMNVPTATTSLSERELVLTRLIDAPRVRVFEAWTQRLTEWWGPHGMTTPVCEMDLRPGGTFRTVMRAPNGSEYPTKGIFLEVVKNERIVFTDAYDAGWQPSADIFFTAITTFEDMPGAKTKYTARALHWTVENKERHEQMGFHHGWGESIDRLVTLVTKG